MTAPALPYNRFGSPELRAALWVMLITVAVFWLSPLDITVQRLLYAGGEHPWPIEDWLICRFFYYSAPVLAGVIGLGSLAFWVTARFKARWRPYRRYALYLFLCLALGPGLVINAIFKDYSGRPRPRQTVEFGGPYEHLRPFETGKIAAGKSFPCGHASVGFVYASLYFLLRRRRPRLAFGLLAASLVFGGMMGWCRMAAGAHFLSDVILAAVMAFLVCHIVYFHLLKIPQWEARPPNTAPPRHFSRWEAIGYGAFALGCTFLLLLAYPYHNRYVKPWPEAAALAQRPVAVDLAVDRGVVTIVLDQPDKHLQIEAEIHGFGLPEKTVRREISADLTTDPPRLRYQHTTHGVFTDFEGQVTFFFDPQRLAGVNAENVGQLLVLQGVPDGYTWDDWQLPPRTLQRDP